MPCRLKFSYPAFRKMKTLVPVHEHVRSLHDDPVLGAAALGIGGNGGSGGGGLGKH